MVGREDLGACPPVRQSVYSWKWSEKWWGTGHSSHLGSERWPLEVFKVDNTWQREVTGWFVALRAGMSPFHLALYPSLSFKRQEQKLFGTC